MAQRRNEHVARRVQAIIGGYLVVWHHLRPPNGTADEFGASDGADWLSEAYAGASVPTGSIRVPTKLGASALSSVSLEGDREMLYRADEPRFGFWKVWPSDLTRWV